MGCGDDVGHPLVFVREEILHKICEQTGMVCLVRHGNSEFACAV
jgi:hypothetical protein